MKRSRDSETSHDKRSSGSRLSSSSSTKEGTTSTHKSSCYGERASRTDHRDDNYSRSKRERSSERSSTSSKSHGTSRSGRSEGSPSSRNDRSKCRRDTDRDRRTSRSRSVDKHRSSRRHSRSRSRERRSSKSSDCRQLPERRRSPSKGSSRERQGRHNRGDERGSRRSHSRSQSLSPRHSNSGSSSIVVTGPDSERVTVHIPEPIKKSTGGRENTSNLPLNDSSSVPSSRLTTPQMAVQQAMAAMSQKAQQITGVSLPRYYNPAAVNPLKYAEQVQKRKLLWQKKEKVEAPSNNNWEETSFAQDQDGKVAAKFKRLMGLKAGEKANILATTNSGVHLKKQEELFKSLDQQYEQARVSTHTHRGVGLGYSSSVAGFSGITPCNMFPK